MNTEKINASVYMALNNQSYDSNFLNSIVNPSHNIPIPTKDQYSIGFMDRFFVKRINDPFCYETTELDYNVTDLTIWQRTSLNWKLTGYQYTVGHDIGIEPYNKIQISKASNDIFEIRKLLTNPIQFAKISS